MVQLQDLFLFMFNMSITASYVILAVLFIRFCIRKAPKAFSYGLWAVAGFRLVCPVSFSSVISIFNLIGSKAETGGALNYISSSGGNIKSDSHVINYAVSAINRSAQTVSAPASVSPVQMLLFITTLLWVIGIVLILTYSTISYLRLKYRIRSAVRLKDNVYQSEAIPAPFVMGILRPRIYIPFHMKEPELSYVLFHEKYHIKRYDYLTKPLSFLLAVVYWYHPLVWIAYLCMCKDMEMSCDEKVIKDMGLSNKKAYSMSLLSFATNRRFPAASPLAFGEINIQSRIKNILNYKKTRLWVTVFLILLCFITIITCMTNPSSKTSKPNEKELAEDIASGVSDLAKQLYAVKNPYIGNASANGKLLFTLGVGDALGNFTLELETSKQPYILRLNFNDEVYDRDTFDHKMAAYATFLLALIENADEIQWSYPYNEAGDDQRITVYWDAQNLHPLGIEDIKTYGESAAKVQELIDTIDTSSLDMNLASAANVTDIEDGSPEDGNLLIMNDIIKLKDWGKLSLDDWKAYTNAVVEEDSDESALNSYVIFELSYGNDIYKLQVSYMKADQQIDIIYLTRQSDMETVLLYSSDSKYSVTTDIEGYLTTKVDMNHYLTYQLPESMENSAYNAAIGMNGGNLFLMNKESSESTDHAPAEWSAPGGVLRLPMDSNFSYVTFEKGKLVNGTLGNNHTEVLGKPVILNNLNEQAILIEVQHDLYTASDIAAAEAAGNPIPVQDQVSTMYEIYFARENSLRAYCIFLNQKHFTYDEAITLVNSVNFTDQAFR